MPAHPSYRKRNRSNSEFIASDSEKDRTDVTRSAAAKPTARAQQGKRRPPASPQNGRPDLCAKAIVASVVKSWQPDCEESSTIYDVVADESGAALLLPLDGGEGRAVSGLREDEVVTIRVFRFFEDKADQARTWERELRNVNSGSLLWLVVHLQPKMHSVSGAKYGRWFTTHHIRVCARNLRSSGYFMFEEGACALAKTFGATSAVKSLVSGEKLSTGYFWFASPDKRGAGTAHEDVTDDECLKKYGWQHLGVQGLFNGDSFLSEWCRHGSSIKEPCLQKVLRSLSPEDR